MGRKEIVAAVATNRWTNDPRNQSWCV